MNPWLTLLSALLGASIGGPLIEWFKDHFANRTRIQSRIEDIVTTLRLIVGVFDGFQELTREAYRFLEHPDVAASAAGYSEFKLACVRSFDLRPIYDSLPRLSALHPTDSRNSAAGQRLIQHITVVACYFEQLKKITPLHLADLLRPAKQFNKVSISTEDHYLLTTANAKFIALQSFIAGIYAERLGLDGISVLMDREIFIFEAALEAEHRRRSQAILQEAMERVQTDEPAPQE